MSFVIDATSHGARLDIFLQKSLAELSRARCQGLIREGHALLNGQIAKPSQALKAGDRVAVIIPPPKEMRLQAEEMPLAVLFEDGDLLILNKPPGLVVHPAAGHEEHTLVNALLHHCRGQLSGIGGVSRPGIVHRLDKDTSGCLVVAKNDTTHRALVELFQGRDVWKEYLAIVWGTVARSTGKIDAAIGRSPRNRQKMAVRTSGGKPALTEYEVIERAGGCSVMKVRIHTGRTHQIRVHFASLGHPVVGDTMYGRARNSALGQFAPRQMLHAHRLGFEHPGTHRYVEVSAPLPSDMREFIRLLRREADRENARR